MTLVDESGKQLRNSYEIEFPNMSDKIAERIKHDGELMQAFTGAVLYGPDGKRLELSKPMRVSTRAFRMPLRIAGMMLMALMLLALPALAQKSQSYTLTVIPAPCAVTITTATVPQAQASIPYSFQFAATSTGGCSLPLVFTSSTANGQTGLPSGLTLSASGLLSGTIPATYCTGTTCPAATFTLTVKDQSGVGAVRGIVKDGKLVAATVLPVALTGTIGQKCVLDATNRFVCTPQSIH